MQNPSLFCIQVLELALDGARAVAQWLRQQLLAHVQQIATCRNVS